MGSLSRGGSVPPQGVSLFHPGVCRPAPGMGRRGDPPRPRRPGDAHEPGIVEMAVFKRLLYQICSRMAIHGGGYLVP